MFSQVNKRFVACIFLLLSLISGTSIYALASPAAVTPATTVVSPVGSSANDAEERLNSGIVDLTSPDLQLGNDNNAPQLVGIRFTNITIPPNAIIVGAYLEFTVAAADSVSSSVTIWGQSADNAPAFTTTKYSISGRTRTTAKVAWNNMAAWPTVGAKVQSPSIGAIVQELVNRSKWASGNSIVILIEGSGQRTATSYDGGSSAAPRLVIDYSLPTATPTQTQTRIATATSTPTRTPTATATATGVPGSVRFGVIGDYGDGSQPELDVANLVKSWKPDFVITTGDNNYPDGGADTIDEHIGQYYREFIYPYKGTYGPGATTNRFFPTLGNHDWTTTNGKPYLDYFTLPGNERYYDYVWGPIHFFVLDSDDREPDGNTSTSKQAVWLQNRLATSTSNWNLVYFHHPPYSSGSVHPSDVTLRWPFASWGADAVLTGHSHTYERLLEDQIVYFVNGVGGGSLHTFSTAVTGSQVRYSADYGAMLVTADTSQITFKFINRAGLLIDSYSLQNSSDITAVPPPSPFDKISPVDGVVNQPFNITLNWEPSANATSYQYCVDTTNDSTCDGDWINNGTATSKSLSGLSTNTIYYWQVRAWNTSGTTIANGSWWSFRTLACYTLSKNVSPSGSGTIDASAAPNCNGQYTSGTVVQLNAIPATGNAFSNWTGDIPASDATTNPVDITMTGNKTVTANFTAPNVYVYIGGGKQADQYVASQESIKQSYDGVDNGPVKVVSIDGVMPLLSSQRFIYSYQNSKSYAEMMGYPGDQLTTEYWFPWYNNISYSTQLRVSNMGVTSTQIKVYAGPDLIDTFSLFAGQGARKSYDIDSGPLHVISADGVTSILASERFIQTFMDSASYAEMMGYPGDQLTTAYWFPWYNNISYSTQLRVSNLGNGSANIKVYAGTDELDSFTLSAGQGARKSYNVDNGPLHVVSTDGVTPILASERFIQTFGTSASYAEMMGYPNHRLTTEYCFPWYNNTNDGAVTLSSQLRVSNMGISDAQVKVYLAGVQKDSFTILAGQGARKSYAGFDGGPLCVVSNIPILASERFISTYINSSSYSEMMGYPTNKLASTYWFPWYNNVNYSTELRISRP